MMKNYKPDGYNSVSPYFIVKGAQKLVDLLNEIFDAKELRRYEMPDGSIMHAQVYIGDSLVMMGEPTGDFGPMPGSIYLSVPDCDAVYKRALEAGAVSVMEPMDMQHAGQRYGGVKDPSGNVWWVATQKS